MVLRLRQHREERLKKLSLTGRYVGEMLNEDDLETGDVE